MDFQNLIQNSKNLKDWEIERQVNDIVRRNYRFKNLDSDNRELVMNLIKKYRSYIRRGIGISTQNIRNELYHLSQNRLKLGLTLEDIKDIKEILGIFQN